MKSGQCLPIKIIERQDLKVLGYFGIDDLDKDTIRSYRNRFSALNPDHPWIDLDVVELFKQLQILSADRKTGKLKNFVFEKDD